MSWSLLTGVASGVLGTAGVAILTKIGCERLLTSTFPRMGPIEKAVKSNISVFLLSQTIAACIEHNYSLFWKGVQAGANFTTNFEVFFFGVDLGITAFQHQHNDQSTPELKRVLTKEVALRTMEIATLHLLKPEDPISTLLLDVLSFHYGFRIMQRAHALLHQPAPNN